MVPFLSNIKNIFTRSNNGYYVDSANIFSKIASSFGVSCAESPRMISAINVWNSVFQGSKTQIMKTVCHEASKLVLNEASISVDGEVDSDNTVKAAISGLENKLFRTLEIGIALGGMIIKPTLKGFDLVSPTNFIPIEYNAEGGITSAIFVDTIYRSDKIYRKAEYHHFEGDVYMIDSKAFVSKYSYSLGSQCSLSDVREWKDISPHIEIVNIEAPLFAYFRMPGFNNIDETSNLGISLCSSAIEYLSAFDNVFDGFKADIETTRKVIFVEKASLLNVDSQAKRQKNFEKNPIPNLIVGMNNTDKIKEFNPSCNVNEFKTALQMLLDMISVSCGFTSGYFTFDNKRAAVTATQIESEDQVTISTISAIRNNLKRAVEQAYYAYITILKLYDIYPDTINTISFYARDLSVTPEADKQHTLELVKQGYYPLELYLKEYEGFTEDDIDKYRDKIPALTKLGEQNIEP